MKSTGLYELLLYKKDTDSTDRVNRLDLGSA